ncbi:MAG: 4a-hydroxytetrahydrobiopterin dehydratase, partial [Candidatus Marinimicrobia bacterium]|nr:4a-hydroxytetrahydrobiopterin dehydratase [Candidatus Neomarinimicrobiota bacterium]
MDLLKDMKCQACRQDSPRVTEQEIKELMPQLPEWVLVERSSIQRL